MKNAGTEKLASPLFPLGLNPVEEQKPCNSSQILRGSELHDFCDEPISIGNVFPMNNCVAAPVDLRGGRFPAGGKVDFSTIVVISESPCG